jgi:hypothetical protein
MINEAAQQLLDVSSQRFAGDVDPVVGHFQSGMVSRVIDASKTCGLQCSSTDSVRCVHNKVTIPLGLNIFIVLYLHHLECNKISAIRTANE